MKRFVDYFAYIEEEYRIRKLQYLVDQTCYLLRHRLLNYQQAQLLFPDQMATYDLIYQTKLNRLLSENYDDQPA